MADDKAYLALMEKEVNFAVNGPKIDQCPICGSPTGRLPWQTKEGLFEQIYGYHYACAKAAETSQYKEFGAEYQRLVETKARKEGKPLPQAGTAGAKIQQAVQRRLDELSQQTGSPNRMVQPSQAPAKLAAETPASEPEAVQETQTVAPDEVGSVSDVLGGDEGIAGDDKTKEE